MRAAKFEPTYISPLREAFERYAFKPLFSPLSCLFFNFMVSAIRIKECGKVNQDL